MFSKLTEEDKILLREFYFSNISHQEKVDYLSTKFAVSERTIRNWWKVEMGLTNSYRVPKVLAEAMDKEIPVDTDVVLVSTAQDKTPIHKQQLKEMIAYKNFIENSLDKKAEIVIIPLIYRNPTTIQEHPSESWWDDEIIPYLYYGKIQFHDTVIWADNRITPTVQNPLEGREGFASKNHLILGHPRIHFKILSRLADKPMRAMCSTGSISYKNYSKSNAGDKSFLHHSEGFVVIEKKKEGECYIPRNVKVKSDGSFCDLLYSVKDEKVERISDSLALIIGDLHYRDVSAGKMDATYKLIGKINPQQLVFHDAIDGSTFNHHEAKDMFLKKLKIRNNKYKIDEELNEVLEFFVGLSQQYKGIINILHSNHDNFLDRLINEGNWKHDIHNSHAYLSYALIQQTVDLREYGNIFGYLLHKLGNPNIKYIKESESLEIGGYDNIHGHLGENGAYGNPHTFRKLNMKTISGHTHTPLIVDGSTVVGTSSVLRPNYVKGLSSWGWADCIIHNNNKNQLICYDYDFQISGLI